MKYVQSQTSYQTPFETLSEEVDSNLSGPAFCTKSRGITAWECEMWTLRVCTIQMWNKCDNHYEILCTDVTMQRVIYRDVQHQLNCCCHLMLIHELKFAHKLLSISIYKEKRYKVVKYQKREFETSSDIDIGCWPVQLPRIRGHQPHSFNQLKIALQSAVSNRTWEISYTSSDISNQPSEIGNQTSVAAVCCPDAPTSLSW